MDTLQVKLFQGYEYYILFIDFDLNKLYISRSWFGFWRLPKSSGWYGLKSAIRSSSRKICERAAGSKARKPGRVVNIEVPLTNDLASSRWPWAWLATSKTASLRLDSSSGVCGPFSTGRASRPCFDIVSAGIIISPWKWIVEWIYMWWKKIWYIYDTHLFTEMHLRSQLSHSSQLSDYSWAHSYVTCSIGHFFICRPKYI